MQDERWNGLDQALYEQTEPVAASPGTSEVNPDGTIVLPHRRGICAIVVIAHT